MSPRSPPDTSNPRRFAALSPSSSSSIASSNLGAKLRQWPQSFEKICINMDGAQLRGRRWQRGSRLDVTRERCKYIHHVAIQGALCANGSNRVVPLLAIQVPTTKPRRALPLDNPLRGLRRKQVLQSLFNFCHALPSNCDRGGIIFIVVSKIKKRPPPSCRPQPGEPVRRTWN